MSEEIITIEDVRRAGYCVRGSRQLISDKGVDWLTFLRHGMSVTEARKHEGMEAMLDHVLRLKRENSGRQEK